MTIKGIVFDFDGLIIDTETAWFEATRETLQEHYNISIELERYSSCIGTTNEPLYAYIDEMVPGGFDRELLRNVSKEKYKSMMKEPMLREGVLEYLQEAKEIGLKIGLASSSSREWILHYLDQCGIREYFDTVKGKDDVKKVKPDPALYEEAVKALAIEPREAIAFEDSLNGSVAALQAGLYCVIVPNSVTNHLPFENFHHRVNSMGDISLEEVIKIVLESA